MLTYKGKNFISLLVNKIFFSVEESIENEPIDITRG